jgi:hypothetical protein
MVRRDNRDRINVAAQFEQALGCGLRREVVPVLNHRFTSHRR